MSVKGIEDLRKAFKQHPRLSEIDLADDLATPANHILRGLTGSAVSFFADAVYREFNRHHVLVFDDREEAAYYFNDIQNITGDTWVFFFPGRSKTPYEDSRENEADTLMRSEVLNALNTRKKPFIIVTYPEAVAEKVVSKQNLQKNTLAINEGDKLSTEFVNEVLLDFEFEREDFVYQPGQYAIRGGILDIWSFSNDLPYRVELFGDEVESIRTFDPATQLSVTPHGKISIVPNVQEKIYREVRQSFLEFLPEQAVLWSKNRELISKRLDEADEKYRAAYEKFGATTSQLPVEDHLVSSADFAVQANELHQIEFGIQPTLEGAVTVQFEQSPQPEFHKKFDMLMADLHQKEQEGFTNTIAAANSKQLERLRRIFEDVAADENFHHPNAEFIPLKLGIHEGFIEKELKIALYTDHQIFERYHRFRLKESFADSQRKLTLKEFTDLQPGDFVVHIDHGVGRFSGLEKIDVNGKMQEAIRLVYEGNDVLYVSIHSLHRISRFSGKEGTEPKINKLGTKVWQNLKNKTKKKVKELAFDLIKLYAERKTKEGFAFQPDTYLQTELEASFIYEDTPDQEKATAAIKEAMERTYPMDMLVCGDVGFGKTELAVRAAFKAATDGKQVAILAPTTILTIQHFKTFRNRLEEFPVTVDYINRFKSTKAAKETLKNVSDGKVDILIGTHRLVSKDVKFKDLGLMIIDEEQKFGVSTKDKLKTMKANVDTLTLTATPIPRTLQFSLLGARDLSVLNTPPPNRQSVQTELHPFSETVIRDAIYAEISRNGQVFFVHNRVQNIDEVCRMIKKFCPEVSIEFAHGQMEGKQLEDIMMRFIEGDFDVLVATTIIESGLDISNANTIIINEAQNFGLSDLHQMRGRVGRSNKKAFCYLLSPPLSSLSSDSRKRLHAIQQFSDLGSGFSIAMRDLDIRGAGNLLGAEQSGFINDIGYETYMKILDEAVQELKQKEFKSLYKEEKASVVFINECQFETDLEIMFPDTYINNITERLAIYKDLAKIKNESELGTFGNMVKDRFGPLPASAERLLLSMRIKWLGRDIGFEKVALKQKKLIGYFTDDQESEYFGSAHFTRVLNYVKLNPARVTLKQSSTKLRLVASNIGSIEKAVRLLEAITTVEEPII